MDQTTFMYITATGVIVGAVALALQAVWIFEMYKASRVIRDRLLVTLPKAEGLIDASKVAVEASKGVIEESRLAISDFRAKSNNILDVGHRQMLQLESLLDDATARTSRQLKFAEAVVEDTLNRVESTVGLVHKGVLKPIRSISGLAAGIGAAVSYLLSRKPDPEGATLDEEMYI
jgi:hypothetical protein